MLKSSAVSVNSLSPHHLKLTFDPQPKGKRRHIYAIPVGSSSDQPSQRLKLGHYDPGTKKVTIFDPDYILWLLDQGAIVTPAVGEVLDREGLYGELLHRKTRGQTSDVEALTLCLSKSPQKTWVKSEDMTRLVEPLKEKDPDITQVLEQLEGWIEKRAQVILSCND